MKNRECSATVTEFAVPVTVRGIPAAVSAANVHVVVADAVARHDLEARRIADDPGGEGSHPAKDGAVVVRDVLEDVLLGKAR